MAPPSNEHRAENGNASREEEREEEDVVVAGEAREMHLLLSVWENNKGAILILISELFGSSMDAMARYLQQGGTRFHTLQVITARMAITFILSSVYMWWIKVPHFPLGEPSVRGWLILRGLFGFVGLFSLYYSVHYLPLAEATVFRFLIPLVTAWSCHVFLGQAFTSTQLTAAIIALVGVIIIAHPKALFGDVNDTIGTTTTTDDLDAVTPAQRLLAISMSLFGIFGAAGAYTVIRLVGGRAHALFSVNYFAFIAAAGSTAALLAIPGIGFVMPHSATEWALLLTMGVFGFVLQFLLTAGLQLDKSPKATAMLYVQVIFALGFDFGIWGVVPGGWSLFGGAIVVASTLWSALQRTPAQKTGEPARKSAVDEETALLGPQTGDEDEDEGREVQARREEEAT